MSRMLIPKPCPKCNAGMTVKRAVTQGHNNNNYKQDQYYSVYCRVCGYGLLQVFMTCREAIQCWNYTTLSSHV